MTPLALSLSLIAAFAAAPAKADLLYTPETAAETLKAATGDALLKAAYTACLNLGGTEGDAAAKAFALAGWDVEGDAEIGFSEISGPGDIFALTWHDGGFCLIQSETVGSDHAAKLVREVFAEAKIAAQAEAEAGDRCLYFSLPDGGPLVDVTSSGNDPTCSSAENSGVSFMWDAVE